MLIKVIKMGVFIKNSVLNKLFEMLYKDEV